MSVRETSVRESDCPGNVCKAYEARVNHLTQLILHYQILEKLTRHKGYFHIILNIIQPQLGNLQFVL